MKVEAVFYWRGRGRGTVSILLNLMRHSRKKGENAENRKIARREVEKSSHLLK
jgi:hypothetical protein